MNKLYLSIVVAGVAFSGTAMAGYLCRSSCTGIVDKIIDAAIVVYKEDADKFESKCQLEGGKSVRGQGDPYGFDSMGCWAPRDRNEHYYYCVVEEKAEATGFAVTVISEMGGGKFTASSGAHDSCEKNLGRHACGNHLSEAHDVKAVSIDCHEI